MAIAIDKNNVIMNGNDVVLVMALLSKKFARVINADGLSRKEVRALRLQTNTLPRNSTDEFVDKITRLQLD